MALSGPEPRLVLEGGSAKSVSDCANGCGNGNWCLVCRAEISREALRWIRELNVVNSREADGLSWSDAWSRDLLLARR